MGVGSRLPHRGILRLLRPLQIPEVPRVTESSAIRSHTELRVVILPDFSERANRVVAPPGRFEEIFLAVSPKYDPRMTAVSLQHRHRASHDEVGVDAHLHELPPCPQREVLAVTPSQLFERARMLPEVRLLKQVRVAGVLAAREPRPDLRDGPCFDRALAFEVPGEILARARAERLERRGVAQMPP